MKCMHEEDPLSSKTMALLAVSVVALALLSFVFHRREGVQNEHDVTASKSVTTTDCTDTPAIRHQH